MKNIVIGLCLGLIIALWAFYFFQGKDRLDLATLPPTPVNSLSDYDQIKMAIANKHNKSVQDTNLSLSDNNGTHARGSVKFASDVAGAWLLAAKDKGAWVIVQDGNGTISCETIAPYSFPKSMVSECVNSAGKLIKL